MWAAVTDGRDLLGHRPYAGVGNARPQALHSGCRDHSRHLCLIQSDSLFLDETIRYVEVEGVGPQAYAGGYGVGSELVPQAYAGGYGGGGLMCGGALLGQALCESGHAVDGLFYVFRVGGEGAA